MAAKFRNAGQTCVCANRIYVQSDVYDTFAAMFAEKVKQFTIGHGLDDGTVIGPLINAGGVHKSTQHVDDAVAKGASVLTGGGQSSPVACLGLCFSGLCWVAASISHRHHHHHHHYLYCYHYPYSLYKIECKRRLIFSCLPGVFADCLRCMQLLNSSFAETCCC